MFAKDLKNVSRVGKMRPYAIIYLSYDPVNEQRTPVYQDGGRNPSWNKTMRFSINEAAASQPDKLVVVIVKHKRKLRRPDKDVGRVDVSLKALLDAINGSKDSSLPLTVNCQLETDSSRNIQGEFTMTCKVVDNQSTGGLVSSTHGSFTVAPLHGEAPSASVVGYSAQSHGIGVPPVGYQGGYHRPPPTGNASGAYRPSGGFLGGLGGTVLSAVCVDSAVQITNDMLDGDDGDDDGGGDA